MTTSLSPVQGTEIPRLDSREPPAPWSWHHTTLERLRAELLHERGESGPVPSIDLADLSAECDLWEALPQDHRVALLAVDDALQRIDDGTYGVNADTGREFDEARLRALPWRT
jgi:RNA polymerase-binding transcription factor DksA